MEETPAQDFAVFQHRPARPDPHRWLFRPSFRDDERAANSVVVQPRPVDRHNVGQRGELSDWMVV